MVIVFLDIETTGFDYRVESIISIQLKVGNTLPEILPSWESSEIAIIKTMMKLVSRKIALVIYFSTLSLSSSRNFSSIPCISSSSFCSSSCSTAPHNSNTRFPFSFTNRFSSWSKDSPFFYGKQ